jgi:outer membrane protein assembly factor BamB
MPSTPTRARCLVYCALILASAFFPTATQAQTDGAQKWAFGTISTAIVGNIVSSPAVAADGTIYVGTEIGSGSTTTPSGRLFAISPAGAQKWVFTAPDWIDSSPAIGTDGTIYFGCWDGNLYALNPNGTTKWTCSLGSFVSGSPAIGADGTIYIGTGNGNLFAVNPDGSVKWLFATLYWIDSSPAVAPDGTIYVGSEDNTFYAIAPDGTEKWHYTTGSDIASSPAIAADGTVYIGSRDLSLYAFTPSGAVKWTYATTDFIDASPVLAPDGTVYIATTGGRVFALKPDGTLKWQYPAATQPALSSLYSTPAVRSDGSLVFGTSDNAVYALRADGSLLWKAPVGDWVDSSPAVAPDGSIYVGCTDKNLYAFTGTVAPSFTDWPELLRTSQRNGLQLFGGVAGTTGRLSNMSVRTFAGSDASTLIVGFTVAGSGSRSLLVRGVGPTLTSFSVSGVLADPRITFYSGQTATTTNDNWGQNANASAISTTAATLGAFPLPQGSLDAAMLSTFQANQPNQTVQVTGPNGSTGIALLELYDGGGSSTARLTNLSARSFVDIGGGVLIAGFVVVNGTRTVLIRGIGPTLSNFGISGSLANPQLRLFNSQQIPIAENDNWATPVNASTLSTTSQSVGAFGLSGTQDSVMLLTLPVGSYSAQVSGVNSTTGVGMIEVYEVP